jgi:hypothetical protein
MIPDVASRPQDAFFSILLEMWFSPVGKTRAAILPPCWNAFLGEAGWAGP